MADNARKYFEIESQNRVEGGRGTEIRYRDGR